MLIRISLLSYYLKNMLCIGMDRRITSVYSQAELSGSFRTITSPCIALPCILLHCFATKEWLKILAFTIQQNLLLRKVPVSKSHHYLQTTADEMEFFRFLTTNEPMNNWIAISFGHVEPALATACGRLLAPNEGSKSDFSLMWTWPPSIKDGTVQFRLLHFLFHHSRRTVSNPLVKIALPDVV